MQELQNKVIKWAEDKGIFANSDPISQFLKTISEVGELADAVNKNDLPEIKDAIGDVAVTLILYHKMLNTKLVLSNETSGGFYSDIKLEIQRLSYYIGQIAEIQLVPFNYLAVDMLAGIASYYGWTLQECLESAYDVISKRTGKMENGVFVKDI